MVGGRTEEVGLNSRKPLGNAVCRGPTFRTSPNNEVVKGWSEVGIGGRGWRPPELVMQPPFTVR